MKREIICDMCKKSTSAYNNQKFCCECSKINNKNVKRNTQKRYYKNNKEMLRRKSREYHHKHYIPHPKKILTEKEKKDKKIEYYQKNKERINKRAKEYKLNNKEKLREQRKKYYKKNLQKIKKLREKYKPRRREINKPYIKNKKNNDIQFNIKEKLRNRLYKAIKSYTKTGKIMTSKQYGINYKKIIEHLKPFPEDISKYHIDHIRTLCSFDLTNLEEIKKAFAPENHQWLIAKENLIKGGKY